MATQPTNRQPGGSFAPQLTSDKLEGYKALAATADQQTREMMGVLIKMVEKFRETPDSTLQGTAHPSGKGTVVPLEKAEIDRMWDHVPWQEELDMYGAVFERINAAENKPLRDAAFHLLWFGRELFLDREPITTDKL